MRKGHGALVVGLVALLVAAGCSDDDDDAGASEATSSTASSTTSTSLDDIDLDAEGADTTSTAAGSGGGTGPAGGGSSGGGGGGGSGGSAPAPTTTTLPPCSRTTGSGPQGFALPDDTRDATVTVVNQHSSSVVVGLAGASYTLSPGQSTGVSLPPANLTVTVAPAGEPGKRFTFSQPLVNGGQYELTVRMMSISSCPGWVDIGQTDFSYQSEQESSSSGTTASSTA